MTKSGRESSEASLLEVAGLAALTMAVVGLLFAGVGWGVIRGLHCVVGDEPYRVEVAGSVAATVEDGPPLASICRLNVAATDTKGECTASLRCDGATHPVVDGPVKCRVLSYTRPCTDIDNNPATCTSTMLMARGSGLTYDQHGQRASVELAAGEVELLIHGLGESEGVLP